MQRDTAALALEVFDVVILGGGITGAGAALDAASRGWRVALIDKGDFASGTSGASSKLVHGGLRYLEYGHLGLVREALHERALLLRNAPHLVKPLPFLLPYYDRQRVARWQWRTALTAYDFLAGRDNIARSRPVSRRALHAQAPFLRRRGLLGGAVYYDALMDDSRLCLSVLQTASRHGSVVANYVEAIGFEKHRSAIAGVWARDRLCGETFLIRGRVVLNATGPWGDAVAGLAGEQGGPYLRPTKGVHLLAPCQQHHTAYLLLHPADGRVFFTIPWQGKLLVGTTDTFPKPDADSLSVEAEEITYLLEGYNHFFEPALRQVDVLGSFAGLRPLLRARPGEPSSLSREFRLFTSPTGLVTAAGGKYTTYRQMAETIVDYLGTRLGKRRRCRTKSLPLEGCPSEPWGPFFERTVSEIQKQYPVSRESAAHLVSRHGSRVAEVLQTINNVPDGFHRVHPEEPDLLGETAYFREKEMALFPEDLFLRRSRIGMFRPEVLLHAKNTLHSPTLSDFARTQGRLTLD